MSCFNLVVDEGKLFVPGDSHQCSKYGYIKRRRLLHSYTKYHGSKLVYMYGRYEQYHHNSQNQISSK